MQTEPISDVSNYWYGYVKKALELGIITKNSSNEIKPDEQVTRGEFALMVQKTLRYSQCSFDTNPNISVAAQILIQNSNNQTLTNTNLQEGGDFYFVPNVSGGSGNGGTGGNGGSSGNGSYDYKWHVTDQNGNTSTYEGEKFNGGSLPGGKYFVSLEVVDRGSGTVVSNPNITVTVLPKDGGDNDGDGVPNAVDQCPNVKGSPSNNGCPV